MVNCLEKITEIKMQHVINGIYSDSSDEKLNAENITKEKYL
jgi:hypothetical protein